MEISQRAVKELIKQFTGQDQMLSIPRPFIKLTGDHECALMLNQILYWSSRTDDPDGWFYKTHEDWAEELELTPSQIRRITKALAKVGVESKLKKHNGAPKMHYRINDEIFEKVFTHFLETETVRPKVKKRDYQQSSQSELSDPITNIPDNQQPSYSDNSQSEDSDSEKSSLSSVKETEITAETTSKITHTPRVGAPLPSSGNGNGNGVGVARSKYSPEFRKDYAKKHGLGPGWLSQSVDGRFDEGIELQLERDELSATASTHDTHGQPIRDTSACPDCKGTGFWYPEGIEKGVNKCPHPRLDKPISATSQNVLANPVQRE